MDNSLQLEIMLQINRSLLEKGVISESIYKEAAETIVKNFS